MPESGEDRKTDLAPLVKVKENEVVMLTATIEPNLRQGDLGEADGKKGDLTETENHSSGDEASSEWEERQKSRRSSPTVDEGGFLAVRQHGCAQRRSCGWLAKAQATARVTHNSTAMLWVFIRLSSYR